MFSEQHVFIGIAPPLFYAPWLNSQGRAALPPVKPKLLTAGFAFPVFHCLLAKDSKHQDKTSFQELKSWLCLALGLGGMPATARLASSLQKSTEPVLVLPSRAVNPLSLMIPKQGICRPYNLLPFCSSADYLFLTAALQRARPEQSRGFRPHRCS